MAGRPFSRRVRFPRTSGGPIERRPEPGRRSSCWKGAFAIASLSPRARRPSFRPGGRESWNRDCSTRSRRPALSDSAWTSIADRLRSPLARPRPVRGLRRARGHRPLHVSRYRDSRGAASICREQSMDCEHGRHWHAHGGFDLRQVPASPGERISQLAARFSSPNPCGQSGMGAHAGTAVSSVENRSRAPDIPICMLRGGAQQCRGPQLVPALDRDAC